MVPFMPMAHHDINVAELAAWLTQQGGKALWAVDGEERLAGELSLPCIGEDLAAALLARGGRIRVYEPPGDGLAPGHQLSRANLVTVAERDDAGRAFRVAWVRDDEAVSDPWLLVEDTLAKNASESDEDAV